MSAVPLIEAVQRAGGTIALRGDRLKVSAPEPLPQELLEEVRQRKTDLIDHLQRAAAMLADPAVEPTNQGAASPSHRIAAWADGVARLGAMPPPQSYPERAWQQLIVDAERFLDGWAGQAAALGWQGWELFGVHRRVPWHRLDARGLVLALQGRELAALTAGEAVMRTATGAHQTYRRKLRDPLHPAERCLAWELG